MKPPAASSLWTIKSALLLAALFLFGTSDAQTKKALVSDSVYSAFFKDIQHSLKTNRIESKTIKTPEQNLSSINWGLFFSGEDLIFQRKQIKNLGERPMKSTLFDSLKIVENTELKPLNINPEMYLTEKTAYYTLGYPLFSADKKRAAFHIRYNGGKYLSEEKIIVYRKVNNHWKEDATILHIEW